MNIRHARDVAIYAALVGQLEIGEKVMCPLPGVNGNSPSFALFEPSKPNEDGTIPILWKCHRTGMVGGAIDLLRYMLSDVPRQKVPYRVAMEFFEKNIATGEWASVQDIKRAPKREATFEFKDQPDDYDLAFWHAHHIPTEKLIWNKIRYPRTVTWGQTTWYSTKTEPMFYWDTPPGGWKLYRPHSPKQYKWRSHQVPDSTVDGLGFIPAGQDIIFAHSSRKDRMVLDSHFPVLNAHGSESAKVAWVNALPDIMAKGKRLAICQDGDQAGYEAALVLAEEINDPRRCFAVDTRPFYSPYLDPGGNPLKDPAGVSLYYGLAAALDLQTKISHYAYRR